MVGKFEAVEGLLKGVIFPLDDATEWVIGRDKDECQIILEDPAVSRKHLLLKVQDGKLFLENLNEANPAYLNDKLLGELEPLNNGDLLKIGSGAYKFLIDGEAKQEKEKEKEEETEKEEEKEEEEKKDGEDEPSRDSILEESESDISQRFPEINFNLSDSSRFLLKVIAGPNNGAEFSLHPGTSYIIGTDPATCALIFHDTSVSRQHLKIFLSEDDVISIEDLKSRNGTLVDGEPLKEKITLAPNTIVSLGTTSFVIFDREGNMQTIISPLLPSIVKVLQKGTLSEDDKTTSETTPEAENTEKEAEPPPPKEKSIGGLILIAIIAGLFTLVAFGIATLFKNEPIEQKQVLDADKEIADVLKPYPSIKFSYNKVTRRLVLFGHLLNGQNKTQMLYSLQSLPFIKNVDDSGVIIDEYVWQEINQVLNKNPNWKTITMQSPAPGKFVLTGTLQSSKVANQLYEYINTNFPYLDRLERNVIVEDEVLALVRDSLNKEGLLNVQVALKNGELTLTGGIPTAKAENYAKLLEDFKNNPGIRSIRNQVATQAKELSMVNISDRYEVSGFSKVGNKISVIVNGRIVSKGDLLDGMLITDIVPGTISLEKDDIQYRINFSK